MKTANRTKWADLKGLEEDLSYNFMDRLREVSGEEPLAEFAEMGEGGEFQKTLVEKAKDALPAAEDLSNN